jgi:tetratricopeptide (TPR) repeat protein
MKACDENDQPYWRDWFLAHDVAWALARLGDREKAITYWEECLENSKISKIDKYQNVKALTLRNLAHDAIKHSENTKDWERAIDQLNESVKIWEDIKQPEWAGHTSEVLGMVHYQMENFTESYKYLKDAFQYLSDQKHDDGTISTLAEQSLVLIELDKNNEAIQKSNQAIEFAKELAQPAPSLAYALWRRAQIEEKMGNSDEVIMKLANQSLRIYQSCFASPWEKEAKEWLDSYKEKKTGISKLYLQSFESS